MFIRVSKLSEELKSTYTAAAGFNNCGAIAGRTQLFDIEYSWHEKGVYRGMLSTFNQVGRDISKPVSVRVLDYYSADPYYTGSVKFNIPFEIDLSCIECFSDERLNFFRSLFMWPGKLRTIRFEFTGSAIQAILDKLPTARVIERNGRTYTVEADVYGDGIKMWLLSQGRRIKVISPIDLVEEMKKEVELLYAAYNP